MEIFRDSATATEGLLYWTFPDLLRTVQFLQNSITAFAALSERVLKELSTIFYLALHGKYDCLIFAGVYRPYGGFPYRQKAQDKGNHDCL